MNKKNSNFRGFRGDASEVDNFDWWSPVATPEEEPVDNSWIFQQQIDNERIAREQAQAEAAYQAYLVELEAEIQRQQAIEAQRQSDAIALAIQEEEERKEMQRISARRAAEIRAAEVEAERVA
jgi:hypothetical protein